MTLSQNKLIKNLTDPSWKDQLKDEFKKDYFSLLEEKILQESKTKIIYPKKENIFNAFNFTPFEEVKVVIIGQDPYHGQNQAHGLSFSVDKTIKTPPSLLNIYKEIESNFDFTMAKNGDLSPWAKQGVFLLNTILTVENAKPMSHKNWGWEKFTDEVISLLNEKKENLVFMLWGSQAQAKALNLDLKKHLILKSSHPSPLSSYRGFLGCKHFSLCNQYLESKNKKEINWQIN